MNITCECDFLGILRTRYLASHVFSRSNRLKTVEAVGKIAGEFELRM